MEDQRCDGSDSYESLNNQNNLPRLTVFLDVDNTLTFQSGRIKSNYDYEFTVNGREYKVIKRPHMDEFLDFCSNNFNVYLFTARDKEYAEKIFNCFNNPESRILNFFTVEDMVGHRKNINVLNTPLERTLLIDDWSEATPYHDNLFVVSPFKGEVEDNVLQKLIDNLKDMNNLSDIRAYIHNIKNQD